MDFAAPDTNAQTHSTMPAIFELDQFDTLPLWAQVLISVRMARRAAMAMLKDGNLAAATGVCDQLERCTELGQRPEPSAASNKELSRLPDESLDTKVISQALWWAVDSARAAADARDFPIDATVTHSAKAAMAVLAEHPRVTPLQLTILMAGDLEQLRFTCQEANVGRYDPLTKYVLDRLTPTHPLDLGEPITTRFTIDDLLM